MNPREIEQAIQDAFDGDLDETRAARLRDELKNSPELMEIYCGHALLESELRRHVAGGIPLPVSFKSKVIAFGGSLRKKQHFASILTTAAVLMIAGIVLSLIRVRNSASMVRMETSPGSSLLRQDGTAFTGPTLKRGEPVTLGQGVARLKLETGVAAVIEGPATFNLKSKDHFELSSGHAWFHVPPDARGFRVTSPLLEVVDLGTEFGIDQREDQKPQVHVLKGRVEIAALVGSRQKLELHAGQAAALGSDGKWETIATVSDKFRTRLPLDLPVLRMDFEGIDGESLAIHGDILGAEHSAAKLIRPDLARIVPGVSGNALELNGNGASIETNWQGISGTAPRTISLWCRIPKGVKQQTAPPLVWWGNPAKGWNRKFKVALFTNPEGRTVLRSSFGEYFADGSTELADGSWHHLAVVYRANRSNGDPDLLFYIDGYPEPVTPRNTGITQVETDTGSGVSGCMGIGRYELPEGDRNPFLNAALDDLRIFAGALDYEAIREITEKR